MTFVRIGLESIRAIHLPYKIIGAWECPCGLKVNQTKIGASPQLQKRGFSLQYVMGSSWLLYLMETIVQSKNITLCLSCSIENVATQVQ